MIRYIPEKLSESLVLGANALSPSPKWFLHMIYPGDMPLEKESKILGSMSEEDEHDRELWLNSQNK